MFAESVLARDNRRRQFGNQFLLGIACTAERVFSQFAVKPGFGTCGMGAFVKGVSRAGLTVDELLPCGMTILSEEGE